MDDKITKDPSLAEIIIDELGHENPLNDYFLGELGITVTAKKNTHRITLTCTDRQFNELVEIIDNLGCFYVVEE